MAVPVTQTLGSVFGSGFMAGETGIMLNNLMFFFDLDANSPMSIELGEMRSGPLSPTMLFKQEQLFLAIGTPGAFGIPQTTMQMVSNVVDLGYSAQAAIQAPRFGLYVVARLAGSTCQRFGCAGAQETRARSTDDWRMVARRGWRAGRVDRSRYGRASGADPRDGYSIGF